MEEKRERHLSNQSQAAKKGCDAGTTWNLQEVLTSTATAGGKAARGTEPPLDFHQQAGPRALWKIPLPPYRWRQCRLIAVPSIKKNYHNAHFTGLSQGLFNISEELWGRNSAYCLESHRIWKDFTWILHDHASVADAAPTDFYFFFFHPSKAPQKLIYSGQCFSEKCILFCSLMYPK